MPGALRIFRNLSELLDVAGQTGIVLVTAGTATFLASSGSGSVARPAGTLVITTGKTFTATGTLTLAGTDGSTLNIGTGGTLGTAAYTAIGAYEVAGAAAAAQAASQPLDSDLTALAALSGTNTIYYRSAANTWTAVTIGGNMTFSGGTLDSTASGSGDVVGPAIATDNAVVRFDLTTGKLVQDSAVTIADTTGAITGGTYNKVTITAPATASTLTIADGKTLTASNTLTFTGTDGTSFAFPATSSTVATLAAANAFTGINTITRTGATDTALTVENSHVSSSVYGFLVKASGSNVFGVGRTDAELTVPLEMSDNNITGVADPSNAQDAATKAYVDLHATGTNTGDQSLFSTIAVSGQSNVVADATGDTLTLAAGSNITITTNATTDTITIASAGGAGAVATDTIWDAAGDLVQGTGADTAARLAIGTAGQPLVVNAGATAVAYATLGYAGGGTNATTQAGAVTNMQGAKIFANAAAIAAATPTVAGQLAIGLDGSWAMGVGTGVGDYVVPGWSCRNPTMYFLALEAQGNLTQTTGTSQLKSLTVSTGNLVVTAGNFQVSAGTIYGLATAGSHRLNVTGSTFVDNVLDIQNTTVNGGSKGYSAIAMWNPNDTIGSGRAFAVGVGPTVASNEYANRAYFGTNPPSGSPTDAPMDILISQERSDGTPANQHARIFVDGTNKRVRIYGWDTTNCFDTAFVEVDGNGLFTANSGLTASGTITLGTGTGVAKLTAGVVSAGVLKQYLGGFAISNNAGDATNDIDIASGEAADSTNASMLSDSGKTKQTDAVFAAGTNAGADLRSANLAGTITTVSTTAVVGVSTTFTTDFVVGDVITSAGGVSRRIVTITDNTNMVTETAMGTEAAVTYKRGGKAPSTWYGLYALLKDSDATVDYGCEAIMSGRSVHSPPDFPSGYTKCRRIGKFYRDASNVIRPWVQLGDYFEWSVPTLDYDVATISTSTTTFALNATHTGGSIPPGDRHQTLFNCIFFDATANILLYLFSPNTTAATPSVTAGPLATQRSSTTAGGTLAGQPTVISDTGGQISARSSDTSSTLRLSVMGYYDSRGRN